jgi:hypothetical protein
MLTLIASGSLGSSVVTAIVGTGDVKKELLLHEDMVCKRSVFFRKYLDEEWKEGQDRVINFPDDDPNVFELWAKSTYIGHVEQSKKEERSVQRWVVLGHGFVLAEKLQDTEGKNIIVKAIFNKAKSSLIPYGESPCPEVSQMISIVYDATPGPCLIRKLLVDIFVFYQVHLGEWGGSDEKAVDQVLENVPSQFPRDLSKALMVERTYGGREFTLDPYLEKVASEGNESCNGEHRLERV